MNDLIDAYFEQRLTDEEKETFDRLLLTDSMFADDFEFQRKVRAGFVKVEREKSRAMLRSFEKKKQNKLFHWKYMPIAAGVILVLTISLYKYLIGSETKKLYTSYYQPLPNVVSPNVRGDKEMDNKTIAFSHYESEEYEAAEKFFGALQFSPDSTFSRLYQAICLIELNEVEKAKIVLKTESEKRFNQPYASFAEWYLALCYLQSDEKEQAIAMLEKIKQTVGHPQQSQAIRLLDELE